MIAYLEKGVYNVFMQTAAVKRHKKVVVSRGNRGQTATITGISGSETRLYYFGARYLDPKTSRWLSADPAMYQGDYLPSAPVNDEVKERNGNLPGMGGVYNYVNLHVYHYGANNPIKYVDPDGRYLINNVAARQNARDFANRPSTFSDNTDRYFGGGYVGAHVFSTEFTNANRPSPIFQGGTTRIELPNNMNQTLRVAISIKNNRNSQIQSGIKASAVEMKNGRYEVRVTVSMTGERNRTETVAFAGANEIMTDGVLDQSKIDKIANDTINIALNQRMDIQNID